MGGGRFFFFESATGYNIAADNGYDRVQHIFITFVVIAADRRPRALDARTHANYTVAQNI